MCLWKKEETYLVKTSFCKKCILCKNAIKKRYVGKTPSMCLL
jgi:hypothetical protein